MKIRPPKKIHPSDIIAVYQARAAAAEKVPQEPDTPELAPADIDAIYTARMRQHLKKIGWLKSAMTLSPVDRTGNPIPWYTYACQSFLTKRVRPDFRVFEYGSGHSTLWWSQRVAHVTSVEHNPRWYERIAKSAPRNVHYILKQKDDDYAPEAARHAPKFDVVVIDGHDRARCALYAPESLTDRGVVIWDNADRDLYQSGYDHLYAKGFRRIDFDSIGPIWSVSWTTTVFYRDQNCLGI
jgi:hypothetical protein